MLNATRSGSPLWRGFAVSSPANKELQIVSGQGCWVTDAGGRTYLNAFSGLSLILGIGRPEIERVISRQLKSLPYAHLARATTRVAVESAQSILDIFPDWMGMARVMFSVTGSEAVEGAIKIARHFHRLSGAPERKIVIGLDRSYHGVGFGAISVSGVFASEAAASFGPLMPAMRVESGPREPNDCSHCKSVASCSGACATGIEQAIQSLGPDQVAAVIVEPVIGAGGAIVPASDFFRRLSALCSNNGILLIADESATGCGRTGRMLGIEHSGVAADIVVLSKAINAGYLPVGAIVCTKRVFDAFDQAGARVLHGASQAGNPICLAAVKSTLDIVKREGLAQRAAQAGDRLRRGLLSIPHGQRVLRISGLGLMTMIIMDDASVDCARFAAALEELGVLAYAAANRIGLFPPLTIGDDEIDMIIDSIGRAAVIARR